MRVRTFFALASLCAAAAACDTETTGPTCVETISTVAATRGDTVVTTTGLRYINQRAGSGAAATACTEVGVHYTLFVNNAAVDSLRDPARVFAVTPGRRPAEAIPGFLEGLLGLQVGSQRRLIIPPSLGYGSQPVVNPQTGQVLIPGNSTLVFDVDVRQLR
jgi:peptidylprolyl isomerase